MRQFRDYNRIKKKARNNARQGNLRTADRRPVACRSPEKRSPNALAPADHKPQEPLGTSAPFKIPMICSSLNRLRFMLVLPSFTQNSILSTSTFLGSGSLGHNYSYSNPASRAIRIRLRNLERMYGSGRLGRVKFRRNPQGLQALRGQG
jgi:hypothetical protein